VLTGDRGGDYGVYHVTAGGATSWFGFAERILALDPARSEQRATRVHAVPSTEFPTPARRPLNGLLNTDRFVRRFAVALPDWESSLREVLSDEAVTA
jgi:dTDP-4-dehydrorhamnose reductase